MACKSKYYLEMCHNEKTFQYFVMFKIIESFNVNFSPSSLTIHLFFCFFLLKNRWLLAVLRLLSDRFCRIVCGYGLSSCSISEKEQISLAHCHGSGSERQNSIIFGTSIFPTVSTQSFEQIIVITPETCILTKSNVTRYVCWVCAVMRIKNCVIVQQDTAAIAFAV